MEISDFDENTVFSVVGVCGINGNLIARILMDHGFKVQANDMVNENDCKYKDALINYSDMKIYYGSIPESFFTRADYMILPEAIIKSESQLFQTVKEHNIPLITVDDILELFSPVHPVICITGTNGKTTTTNILKHIVYSLGKQPCEHNLKGMQGNIAYIPALQSRLHGDLNILETGTFGKKGSLTKLVKPCEPDAAIITNITPDHLTDGLDFLDYARVKGELINLLQNKTLIVNNDDPTIKALLNELDYKGNLISFGLDIKPTTHSTKKCFCGNNVEINEYIAGVGEYKCSCGIKYSKPDYLVTNINKEHDKFTLITPSGEENYFELSIKGIHNIYNAAGSIIAAYEVLHINFEDIQKHVKTFNGVKGRMELIGSTHNKQVMIDYAHNPAGISTVLKELKNSYNLVINVITTSSESGIEGDKQILDSAAKYADYIIPASHNAYICAKNALKLGLFKNKVILPEQMPEGEKQGTLGASFEQVLVSFKKALEIEADIIVCTGEAAFKYKDLIKENLG